MRSLGLAMIMAGLFTLAACQPNDPPLTAPQVAAAPQPPPPLIERPVVEVTANGLVESHDSRVDILLVIDDSASMKAHTGNLSENIQKFVDGFSQMKAIDFHIAYTTVHDRLRYGPIVPRTCSDSAAVGWEDPGTLKALTGAGAPTDRRYLTAQDVGFAEVLKRNLDPLQNLNLVKNFNSPSLCEQGPEAEESFTPALGAIELPTRDSAPNRGFRRAGAFFVTIFVSDAKDESIKYGLTAQEFVRRLKQDVGETTKKLFRVYSVAIGPGTVIGKSEAPGVCLPDPAFADSSFKSQDGHTHYRWPDQRIVKEGENPLVTAARLTEDDNSPKDGQFLSVCSSDFGKALTTFGYQVKQDALTNLDLELDYRPQILPIPDSKDPKFAAKQKEFEAKRLRVFIGNVELKEGRDKDWSYNPQSLTVTVYGQRIKWNEFPNEKIRISYTPVDGSQGTTKPIAP